MFLLYFGSFRIVQNEGCKQNHTKNARKTSRNKNNVIYSDKCGFRGQQLCFGGPKPYRPRHLSVKTKVIENTKQQRK